ncbi:hypothetical protein GV794_08235 [Nocardia cyriacigeorgica]|uniref:Uncharacterized protein n=1 Tax=Nocardia cyriacigeorgica TaxID=135487 RepID=A0ABX0CMQ4_9NOCA|nr:hypothetical protein [Nocardia cyriacigeorgica]NEW40888.1 hypothetical protein [Nocardia cyriacigeorgica]NEW50901.1 hypothetical protein [Nocardia cyriacigeorgica]NEW55641.1 hypothetical protein [Nocardia cyriacigeorgica]
MIGGAGDLPTPGVLALRAEAWAARDVRGGPTITTDGFGVAWWRPPADGAGPVLVSGQVPGSGAHV